MEQIDRLRGIVAFLPCFEAPGFEFGHWESRQHSVNSFLHYSDAAEKFIRAAYRLAWIVPGFNWNEWMDTVESKALREDAAVLARATPEQLAKLLTAYVRGDRFCEGALLQAFESGLLVRVLRRAEVILAGIEAGVHPARPSR